MKSAIRIGLCASVVLACAGLQTAWGRCDPGELAKLTASDAAASDYFGLSVSNSGKTAVIAAVP